MCLLGELWQPRGAFTFAHQIHGRLASASSQAAATQMFTQAHTRVRARRYASTQRADTQLCDRVAHSCTRARAQARVRAAHDRAHIPIGFVGAAMCARASPYLMQAYFDRSEQQLESLSLVRGSFRCLLLHN
mmetsp:Transcript_31279/g.65915  ORF Transcript_31279/g.65915 Transcript_31279/m.65915 type:complete len:132 (-) Transcript_31279:23-418(-)